MNLLGAGPACSTARAPKPFRILVPSLAISGPSPGRLSIVAGAGRDGHSAQQHPEQGPRAFFPLAPQRPYQPPVTT